MRLASIFCSVLPAPFTAWGLTHVRNASDLGALKVTQGLVDYLRYFAASRLDPVRDFPGDESVILLSDLPEGMVRSTQDDRGVLISVEYLPMCPHPPLPDLLRGWLDEESAAEFRNSAPELPAEGPVQRAGQSQGESVAVSVIAEQSDAPEVVRAYLEWRVKWQEWAVTERAAQACRDLHQKLTDMRHRIARSDGADEAVLAVGLLTGTGEKPGQLSRHVLTRRLSIVTDRDALGISVVVDRSARCDLEDQDFLGSDDGYVADRSEIARGKFAGQDLDLLGEETWSLLCWWASRSFERVVNCDGRYDKPAPVTGALTLTRTPAIIVRERDGGAVARYYDRIAAELKAPGARAPLGLAQLVTPLEREERLAWNGSTADEGAAGHAPDGGALLPLQTNEAQRQVLTRMRSDTAVVVQGPPGTGKTHTIANLICSLLAEGKRVLVTSEKEQALRELGRKLPPLLRDLCVTLAGAEHGKSDDFDQSVTTLSERLGSFRQAAVETSVERSAAQRDALLAKEQRLYNEIVRSREAEWAEYAEVSPGYGGTLAQVAARVVSLAPRFEWLYSLDPDFDGEHESPPPSAQDAVELLGLLMGETDARRTRGPQVVPAPDSVPSAADFEPLAKAVHTAEDIAARASDTARKLACLDESVLSAIEGHADLAARALHRLRMPPELATWPSDAWQTRYLRSRLASPGMAEWSDIETAAQQIEEARCQIRGVGAREVQVVSLGAAELATALWSGEELRRYLLNGGRLRPPFLASRQQRGARAFLNLCLIDGRSPGTVHDVHEALAWLHAQATADTYARRWETIGFEVLRAEPLPARLGRLAVFNAQVRHLDAVAAAHDAIDDLLAANGIWLPLAGTMKGWDALCESLHVARSLAGAGQCHADLEAFTAALPPPLPRDPPELGDLRRAASAADADGYSRAYDALRSAYQDWRDQQRSDVLLACLRKRHPRLAAELAAVPEDTVWGERLRFLPEAWAWLAARAFCEKAGAFRSERDLQRELDDTQLRLTQVTERLAASRAWLHLLRRITEPQQKDLAAYRAAMAQLGKGKGDYADVKRAEVRSALKGALAAVPAWIMPIQKIAETVPPQRDAFDVVIIDEASQAGVDAAFLLWLAPQVIAVGDDRQCSPGPPRRKNQRHLDRLTACLPALAPHERTALGPGSNLYELLSQRFPNPVRLTEHFRSMPEIIGWSSKMFYGGSLVPLRQYGADRMRPLQFVHVENGRTRGDGQNIRNEPEARRLVEKLQELLNDPAYLKPSNKTVAIIALQGKGQVQLIQHMIRESISSEALDRHSIRVGDPPQFQGAEYDVVMLSMVVAKPPRVSAGRAEQRRFNVAASRARDQMWLFTSVRRADLGDKDLRLSFLEYMEAYGGNSPSYLGHSPAADEVSPEEPHRSFDSIFEQRVFLAIRQRGYHVIPQFEVGDHRIDLAVIGSASRIAVECDGRITHADQSRIHEDLARERELRRVGWRFWRIRESEFILDPERALEPLWAVLDDHGISPRIMPEAIAPVSASWSPIGLRDEEDDEEDQDDTPGEDRLENGHSQ
jgi:very-short-patch-repair endonuclease